MQKGCYTRQDCDAIMLAEKKVYREEEGETKVERYPENIITPSCAAWCFAEDKGSKAEMVFMKQCRRSELRNTQNAGNDACERDDPKALLLFVRMTHPQRVPPHYPQTLAM